MGQSLLVLVYCSVFNYPTGSQCSRNSVSRRMKGRVAPRLHSPVSAPPTGPPSPPAEEWLLASPTGSLLPAPLPPISFLHNRPLPSHALAPEDTPWLGPLSLDCPSLVETRACSEFWGQAWPWAPWVHLLSTFQRAQLWVCRHSKGGHLPPLARQPGPANAESLPAAAACLQLLQPEELPGANPAEPPLATSEALTTETEKYLLPFCRLPPLQGQMETLEPSIGQGGTTSSVPSQCCLPRLPPLPRASGHRLTPQSQFPHRALFIKGATKGIFAEMHQSFGACEC